VDPAIEAALRQKPLALPPERVFIIVVFVAVIILWLNLRDPAAAFRGNPFNRWLYKEGTPEWDQKVEEYRWGTIAMAVIFGLFVLFAILSWLMHRA
jgi:hypothetical protein